MVLKRQHIGIIIVLLAILVLFRFVGQIGERGPTESTGPYTVVRVIDGDTFDLDGRGRVRLLGIDTPEDGDLWYDSARIFLERLTLGRQVTLQFDRQHRDRYDRLLAYVFIDTLFINEEIIEGGYGSVYIFTDNATNDSLIDILITAQRMALVNNLGIWSLPYMEEASYIGNSRSLRFHSPECPNAAKISPSNRVVFDTREGALMQGFSPARCCGP